MTKVSLADVLRSPHGGPGRIRAIRYNFFFNDDETQAIVCKPRLSI
jgi:hypothetical protein